MSNESLQGLILEELREFRQDLKDMRADVSKLTVSTEARLTACESTIRPLNDIEKDVSRLKQWKWYVTGACVGLTVLADYIFRVVELVK